MKRQYVTPIIVAEKFSATESAVGCITKISLMDSECVINDNDAPWQMRDLADSYNMFMADVCEMSPDGWEGTDSICYHTLNQAAFTS